MNRRKYLELAEQILMLVRERNLSAGDCLPSEKKQAALFHANHITIRRALRELEVNGKTHSIPSKGHYAGPRPPAARNSGLIGIVLPDDDPYFFRIVCELEKLMAISGLSPVLHVTYGNAAGETRILEHLERIGVDRIVAVPHRDCSDIYRRLHAPTVFFDSFIEGLKIPHVVTDDLNGALHAVNHLLALGHRAIAHIGGAGDETARRRLAGYEQAMQSQAPLSVLQKEYTRQWGYYAAKRLFEGATPPTAIFCGSDAIAAGTLAFLRSNGIVCPGRVSIIGFSNSDISKDLELSTVDQPIDLIAKAIWNNLARQGEGGRVQHETLIPTTLIIRKSVAQPP